MAYPALCEKGHKKGFRKKSKNLSKEPAILELFYRKKMTHLEVLSRQSAEALPFLKQMPFINQFYLAGGTGLALQLGHRLSADFDFFSKKNFDEARILREFAKTKSFSLEKRDAQTIIGTLKKTKIAFFYYPFPLLKDTVTQDGVKTASVLDIACMKIEAISSRGTKRDFIDLYEAAKQIPIKELLIQFETKYSALNYNMMHIKKSLLYFNDAEDEPMPKMLTRVSWKEVKYFFKKSF